jgi:putative membrane protein
VSDTSYERDAGLAAERTELAWGRSALALLACGAAVVKGLRNVTGNEARPAAGVALLALGGLVWLSGVPYARARARATRAGHRPAARSRELGIMAVGTALVGVAALVIALLFPG